MDVFISFEFNHPDAAERIVPALTVFLTAQGITVRTGKDISAPDSISATIKELIRGSVALIAVQIGDSEFGYPAPWVSQEIGFAVACSLPVYVLKHKNVRRNGAIQGDARWFSFDESNESLSIAELVAALCMELQKKGLSLRHVVASRPADNELLAEGWSFIIVEEFNLGIDCVSRGEFEGARRRFNECLEIEPNFWRAANALAMCDIYERDYEDADKRLEKAINRWKHVPKALGYLWHTRGFAIFRWGGGYSNHEALAKANKFYHIALQNLPDALDTRRNICFNLLGMGKIEEAEEVFRGGMNYPGFKQEVLNALELLGQEEKKLLRQSSWIADVLNLGESNEPKVR